MSVSRRRFVHVLGAGSFGALLAPTAAARGLEARHDAGPRAAPGTLVRLDSNENPNGPGRAALDAMAASLAGTHRYADDAADTLRDAVARLHGARPANVWVGTGSTDVLRAAVHLWTSPTRPLVTAAPSFETSAVEAARLGAPVRAVPVRGNDLRLDLAAMGTAAGGDAGLVYLCNPNNPTATVHGRDAVADFVGRLHREAPGCTVLVDEAYHDYVDDPRYATAIPLALEDPRVIVARTFSKVHGLAGMRVGYAVGHADTIARLGPHMLVLGVNGVGAAAALASLGAADHVQRERALNRDAREFTRRFFVDAGFAPSASEANFVMVDLRREVKAFREACRARGVAIGRLFPPLLTHARVTVGSMDEMRRATDVFRSVLKAT